MDTPKPWSRKKFILHIVWIVCFALLWVGAIWIMRYVLTSSAGKGKRDENRVKKKNQRKVKEKEILTDSHSTECQGIITIESLKPRREKRQEVQLKAKEKVVISATSIVNVNPVAATMSIKNSDNPEKIALNFERNLLSLSPRFQKEFTVAKSMFKIWWGHELTVLTDSSFEIIFSLGKDGGEVILRLSLPTRYPADPVSIALQCASPTAEGETICTARALCHLTAWMQSEAARLRGGPALVALLDAFAAHAAERLRSFDVADWSPAEQAALQDALRRHPVSTKSADTDAASGAWVRLQSVAVDVGTKTARQCAARVRHLQDTLRRKRDEKEAAAAAAAAAALVAEAEDEADDGEADDWAAGSGGGAARREARASAAMMGVAEEGDGSSGGGEEEEEEEGEEEGEEEEEDGEEEEALEGHIYALGDAEEGGGGGGPQHRGVQIRLDQVMFGGASVAQPARLRLAVACARCGTPAQAEARRGAPAAAACTKCRRGWSVALRPDVVHPARSAAGYLDLDGCTADQVLPSDFWVACGECGAESLSRGLERGQRRDRACPACFTPLAFAFGGLRLVPVPAPAARGAGGGAKARGGGGGGGDSDDEGGAGRRRRAKDVKVEGLVEGQPLPDRGACAHFRRSRRWLRFPCCGRALACPVCHDLAVQGDHDVAWATRMICGFCSREQPFSNKACAGCGANPSGASGGSTWQGGEGVRDRSRLDKKDSRHVSARWAERKTGSNKASRVGPAAKVARLAKAQAKAAPA